MIYFVHPSDPDAVVNHPWQPHMVIVHLIASGL
jgi:hypothetical protein